jgi:hypothetical protein
LSLRFLSFLAPPRRVFLYSFSNGYHVTSILVFTISSSLPQFRLLEIAVGLAIPTSCVWISGYAPKIICFGQAKLTKTECVQSATYGDRKDGVFGQASSQPRRPNARAPCTHSNADPDGLRASTRAHLAQLLANVGEREDLEDIRRLIEAESTRFEKAQAARMKGDRRRETTGQFSLSRGRDESGPRRGGPSLRQAPDYNGTKLLLKGIGLTVFGSDGKYA